MAGAAAARARGRAGGAAEGLLRGSHPPPRPSLRCGPDREPGASRRLCPPQVR